MSYPSMPPPMPDPQFGGYPLPPQPRRPLVPWIVGGVLVVVAVILVTGLAWPGWMTGSAAATGPCALLPTSQVEQAVGTARLTAQEQGPIYDPVTHTPSHMCTYANPDGAVLADLSVADYPSSVDADQLLQGVASTGTDLSPVTGVADAAGTVTDLGHGSNTALIAVRTTTSSQHLVVVVISAQADPTIATLTELVHTALNAD